MGRLTETRDGRNVIPLRYGDGRWTLETHNTPGCLKERYLSGDPADRLAAYENTGLEPEDMAAVRLFAACADHDKAVRLLELSEADAAGRLKILPCKVGDIVYAAEIDPVIPLHVMALAVYLEGKTGGDFELLSNIGKTIFLSHEEAEAALELHEVKLEQEGLHEETAAKTERPAD